MAQTLSVDHSAFLHNAYSGLRVYNGGQTTVEHSVFLENGDGIAEGHAPGYSPGVFTVRHNYILRNKQYGFFFNFPKTSTTAGIKLENNLISENEVAGIYIEGYCIWA